MVLCDGLVKMLCECREKARTKARVKAEREGQSGRTAFSKGGVSGPNKLECLVAFGNLKQVN